MDAFHILLLSLHEDREVGASYHFRQRDRGDASADLGRSEKKKKEKARVPGSPPRSRIDQNVIE